MFHIASLSAILNLLGIVYDFMQNQKSQVIQEIVRISIGNWYFPVLLLHFVAFFPGSLTGFHRNRAGQQNNFFIFWLHFSTKKCYQLISSSDNKKILLATRNVRLDSVHIVFRVYNKICSPEWSLAPSFHPRCATHYYLKRMSGDPT